MPRACHPYRPPTQGKIERTIKLVRGNFWPGLSFTSLEELNRQAWGWMEAVNHRPHSTTREGPYDRLPWEHLRPLAGQADYDTSYAAYRQVAQDCLFSYRGNRYSVPHRDAGKTVVVKEPAGGGWLRICYQQETIAEHQRATGPGAMVMQPEHYQGLARRQRERPPAVPLPRELVAGPGVGPHFAVPEVEVRPLAVYAEVSHVAAI